MGFGSNGHRAGATLTPPGHLFAYRQGDVPRISRRYDAAFQADEAYRRGLPDMTRTVESVEGADVEIQQVGVSGFRLPLRIATLAGAAVELEGRITGTVALASGSKGINMSRILRTFYAHGQSLFDLDTAAEVVQRYLVEVGSSSARLKVQFRFPMQLSSLRSGLQGWQYYPVVLAASIRSGAPVRRFMELDFTYSSACPCSAELAEHAQETRGVYAIPHSQRSLARLKVELQAGARLCVDELVTHAREALKTETQVLVKREDEQAFAELNGAYVKFVEDAARLVFQRLDSDSRIRDFQVICSHFESLHSHDAVSVICKGVQDGYRADFMDFESLV